MEEIFIKSKRYDEFDDGLWKLRKLEQDREASNTTSSTDDVLLATGRLVSEVVVQLHWLEEIIFDSSVRNSSYVYEEADIKTTITIYIWGSSVTNVERLGRNHVCQSDTFPL